jgi:hypothetical protein
VKAPPSPRSCARCGRDIAWRRKWARDWESVRFCSDACRGARLGPIDEQLERAILDLLEARPRDASICPSEAARSVVGPEGFRAWMQRTRDAARRLVGRGRVVFTQGGRVVDPSTARGPIRLRLARDRERSSGEARSSMQPTTPQREGR